jgi:DNA (cytosine-5)-methyltransferase 1
MIDFFTHNEEKQKEKGNGFRFNVSDGNVIAKTITTCAGNRMDDNFIKIKNATKQGYLEATNGDGVDLLQPNSETRRGRVQKQAIQTLDTMGGEGKGTVTSDLRIRKLTPRECGRLMNVKDEDITNMLKNQSDSSAYHCFGDSICTNVLMAIFGELLGIDWKTKLNELLESKGE